jgi:RNA polymerase sigma-70 factor (ECF subfamily)
MVDSQQEDIESVLSLVQRYARRFTQEHADDLAQYTLIKAWIAWKPEMREWSDAQLSGWLYRIMKNVWIDVTRKQNARPIAEALTDIHAIPESIESRLERCELLADTLNRVTEQERVLLVMASQDYSYGEMAKTLDVTCKVVSHRLFRARQAFRREWEQVAA